LHCNFCQPDGSACDKSLDQTAVICACAHVFCQEHAEEWFPNNSDCPLCRDGPVKLVKTDCSKAAMRKKLRTALLGMAPMELMEAFFHSLGFWVDQKAIDTETMQQNIAALKERNNDYDVKLTKQLKDMDMSCQQLEEEQQEMEKELEEVLKAGRRLDEQLQRCRRECSEMEDKYSSLQRQLAIDDRRDVFSARRGRSASRSPAGKSPGARPDVFYGSGRTSPSPANSEGRHRGITSSMFANTAQHEPKHSAPLPNDLFTGAQHRSRSPYPLGHSIGRNAVTAGSYPRSPSCQRRTTVGGGSERAPRDPSKEPSRGSERRSRSEGRDAYRGSRGMSGSEMRRTTNAHANTNNKSNVKGAALCSNDGAVITGQSSRHRGGPLSPGGLPSSSSSSTALIGSRRFVAESGGAGATTPGFRFQSLGAGRSSGRRRVVT